MKQTNPLYYEALGLRCYKRRPTTIPIASNSKPNTPSAEHWQALQAQVKGCTACPLHLSRTHAVFGVGNSQADLMIIGEAPGFNEDKQGEPFVGRAGKLLNLMLGAIQLKRSEVYIANIVKCRPPENRDPHLIEVQTCTPYLNEQISYIQPKLILALGRVAAHYLLNTKDKLESLRSTIHPYADTNIPLIVTYHPAYLLRNPIDKRKSYLDLLFVKQQLQASKEGGCHGRLSTA